MTALQAALFVFILCCFTSHAFQNVVHSSWKSQKHTQTSKCGSYPSLAPRIVAEIKGSQEADRGEKSGKALKAIGEGMDVDIRPGSIIVAGREIPSLGIRIHQSYEVKDIFDQEKSETGLVEKVAVNSLSDTVKNGNMRYLSVYNENYHEAPVVVTAEEIGLVSLRHEVIDSVLVALPILTFWTSLCLAFAKIYNDRHGGDFLDALLGR